MSPRLDTALDRREAVSALLVMLAAVMGLGALPQETDAESAPQPELPPHTTTRWRGNLFVMGRPRHVSTWFNLETVDGCATLELRALAEADGPVLWSGTFDPGATASLLATLSQLGDAQHEASLIDDRSRRFEISCPDCRGRIEIGKPCKTCHGNYSRTLSHQEAEERYQRDRADYAAKIAALP